MSLRSFKISHLFLETTSLPSQRHFCEGILGLRVIENQFNPPHHHHGIVKYDTGTAILSLNLIAKRKFEREGIEGMMMVFSSANAPAIYDALITHGYVHSGKETVFRDSENHIYKILQHAGSDIELKQLQLAVKDVSLSVAFYGDVLGLELIERTGDRAVFSTGNVQIVLNYWPGMTAAPPDRFNGYLTVFVCNDIHETFDALSKAGLNFLSRVGFSDIGGTARFADPDGHTYCLYEPSEESFGWGSGEMLKQIMSHQIY